jgi:hypothetical protein
MDRIDPPRLPAEPPLAPGSRIADTESSDTAPKSPRAERGEAESEPGMLSVRVDPEAGRFVQILTDLSSHETIWRYPSEAQLAFSRAVTAYLRTFSEK